MQTLADVYVKRARYYRGTAHKFRSLGDLGEFHNYMTHAKRCVWYAREVR